MFFRFKALTRIISLIFCLALPLDLAGAALWESEDLPLPAGTSEQKKESRKIAGSEFEFIFYSSDLGPGQIGEFYRATLTQAGWKESQVLKQLSRKKLPEGVPDLQTLQGAAQLQGASLSKILESNLIFENGDETLILIFLPGGYPGTDKTGFTISRGKKIGLNSIPATEKGFVPESMAQPKKDVYPVYPGASLGSLSEQEHSLRASYFTKDDIEKAASFYKARMSDYNWTLNNERPISKIDKKTLEASCPSCKSAQTLFGISMENWSTGMDFSDRAGNKCRIDIVQVVPEQEQLRSMQMTTIAVDYEEKTE